MGTASHEGVGQRRHRPAQRIAAADRTKTPWTKGFFYFINHPAMDQLLASLRAAAEPTRLRLLALAARGAFCVMEFTEILGQSQPRLSRHLKLLCDCGLLARVREGANVWFALPTGEDGALPRELVARLPANDPV